MPLGWRVSAFEIAGSDTTYDWERLPAEVAGYERVTVFPEGFFERIPLGEMRRGIVRALDALKPDAMAIAGWGTADARACLDWCRKNGAKAIVMSETRAADGRRVWWKEWVKSRIVRKFDAALCGGASHKRYLVQLGMPEERIAYGYNIVDNEFFAVARTSGLQEHRSVGPQNVGSKGERLGPPEPMRVEVEAGCSENAHGGRSLAPVPEALAGPYFLASNRFVERKNLGRLIEAYARYVESLPAGEKSWPMVLLGDGELRGKLMALCEDLGAQVFSGDHLENLKRHPQKLKIPAARGCVVFAGFRQISELPAFYAGAGAFVHPALEEPWGLVINEAMASGLPVLSSRNVGAAEELVVDDVTGYLFDPMNTQEIAAAMAKVVEISPEARSKIRRASREILERKVPTRAFGEGLAKVLHC